MNFIKLVINVKQLLGSSTCVSDLMWGKLPWVSSNSMAFAASYINSPFWWRRSFFLGCNIIKRPWKGYRSYASLPEQWREQGWAAGLPHKLETLKSLLFCCRLLKLAFAGSNGKSKASIWTQQQGKAKQATCELPMLNKEDRKKMAFFTLKGSKNIKMITKKKKDF